jgi:hypothetical protein
MLRCGEDGGSRVEAEAPQRAPRAGRSHWHRVRVETDEGTYLGSLRLNGLRPTLHDALEDGRTYLALWDAHHEASGACQDFAVIHKGTIRQVALLGRATAPAASREQED